MNFPIQDGKVKWHSIAGWDIFSQVYTKKAIQLHHAGRKNSSELFFIRWPEKILYRIIVDRAWYQLGKLQLKDDGF